MGYDITVDLIRRGWKVGIAGRRTNTLKEIQNQFGADKVQYETIDITADNCVDLVRHLVEKTGGMDSFMHFSGIGYQNPELDPEVELKIVQTNAVGYLRMIDFAYNWFKQSGEFDLKHKGQIVVVSSVTATRGMGISTSYSSTKKFQTTYVEALSQLARMHKDPVQFTEIRPGFVATPMLKKKYPMVMSREKALKLIMRAILKRRRLLIFDWKFKVIVFIWRLIPSCIWERMTFVK